MSQKENSIENLRNINNHEYLKTKSGKRKRNQNSSKENDVVWKSSPAKRYAEPEQRSSTTDGEVKVLSQLLERVRRQHRRAVQSSSLAKKPPTPKEKKCNELLKKWLTRTPRTRRRRKRKGTCSNTISSLSKKITLNILIISQVRRCRLQKVEEKRRRRKTKVIIVVSSFRCLIKSSVDF